MTPLSPQAQAVWNAWNDAYEAQGPLEDIGHPIAAALRAVADQVVPDEPDYMRAAVPSADWWDKHDGIRRELLAIAAELEAQQ